MLTGYLPEMQSKHFYKADNDDWNRQLFRQDSLSNSIIGPTDDFDHPTSRSDSGVAF